MGDCLINFLAKFNLKTPKICNLLKIKIIYKCIIKGGVIKLKGLNNNHNMKRKLSIAFLLIFFLVLFFYFYKKYKNEILLVFIDKCQIEKINYIPQNSSLIVGHAYGSPNSSNRLISNKIKNLIIENKFKEIIFTGDVIQSPNKKMARAKRIF